MANVVEDTRAPFMVDPYKSLILKVAWEHYDLTEVSRPRTINSWENTHHGKSIIGPTGVP